MVGELNRILGWEVPCKPNVVLLGILEGIGGSRANKSFLVTVQVVAKRDIAAR